MSDNITCEEYHKDHINTLRSFLLRRGHNEIPESPISLDEEPTAGNIAKGLSPYLDAEAPDWQRVIVAYYNILVMINMLGYQDAIFPMMDAFFEEVQKSDDITAALRSDKVRDAYNSQSF